MAEEIIDNDVANNRNLIIAYLLNAASTKLPIMEREIKNNTGIKSSTFKQSFEMAKEALKKTFGICLTEVRNPHGGKCYICCNELTSGSDCLYDAKQKREITLLFLILSYIFMRSSPSSEGTTEGELESFLSELGIDFSANHDYFGANIKKLVTETFVKQLYLKREKVTDNVSSDVRVFYSWGSRADIEFDKKMVLEASCQIMRKPVEAFIRKCEEVKSC